MNRNGSANQRPVSPLNTSDNAPDVFMQLRGLALFRACSDEFVRIFASISRPAKVPSGFPILQEGELNDRFLILTAGQVEVRVNGETVATLDAPGDLMGEISFLTKRVVSASLFAVNEVDYLEITATALESAILKSKDGFGYHLYDILSTALSEKIIRTNDKARRFEIANRELSKTMEALTQINRTLDDKVKERTQALQKTTDALKDSYSALEAQNMELLASHRKLEELYSSKDMTFQRLNELESILRPLHDTLQELETSAPASNRSQIERAKSQVDQSIEMLKPLSALYSTEQAIRSRLVLLADTDKKQQVISRLALSGTGVKLDIASSSEEALRSVESSAKYDLIFVSSDLADLIPLFKAKAPTSKLVFMASANVPAEVPILKAHAPLISNIVSRHTEDRTFTVKNVATTVSKLVSKDIFGLEKYMIWGVEVQKQPVTGSASRSSLVNDLRAHFRGIGVRSAIVDRAATVAEELLMNAIYDAPTAADGTPLYNHLPRTTSVDLKPGEQGLLSYACDGMLAALSVSDPFGGFGIETLLNYLERNYSPRNDSPQTETPPKRPRSDGPQMEGKGGAGRGLHQIIENSNLVVFNVKRNVRTEVIAFFNLDTRASVEGTNPSFHFFLE